MDILKKIIKLKCKMIKKNNNKKNKRYNNSFVSIYFSYIFKNIMLHFLLWSLSFFTILYSFSYIDCSSSIVFHSVKIKYLYIFSHTFIDFFNIIDIVILLSCVSFFVVSKKIIRFEILESFGIKSLEILKPIFIFFITFGIVKIFIIQPSYIHIFNKYNTIVEENNKIIIKEGLLFNFIDKQDNDMFVINGKYAKKEEDKIYIEDAIFLEYKNRKMLSNVFLPQTIILEKNRWSLYNTTKINQLNQVKYDNKNFTFKTNINANDFISYLSIQKKTNSRKLRTTIYDNISNFFISSSKNDNNMIKSSFAFIILSIIKVNNSIIFVLISFLLFITNARNSNFIVKIIESFLSVFFISHIFGNIESEMQSSIFISIIALFFDISLLSFLFILLYEKNWNYSIYKNIKNDINILLLCNINFIKKIKCSLFKGFSSLKS